MLAAMSTWLPPGPISIGFAVAAIADWAVMIEGEAIIGQHRAPTG